MKYAKSFSLLVFAASLLMLAACGQKSNCNGISFGTSGSGSGAGGVSTGGSVCGSGSNGGAVQDFLFFQQSGNILNTAIFDGTKVTTGAGGLVPSLGAGGSSDMVVVNKSFLYLTWIPQSGGNGQVLGFAINRNTGALTPIAGSPFDAGTSAVDTIVADPQGRFIVVGNSSNGDMSSFKVDATTGVISLSPSSPLTTNADPTALTIDGPGTYIYSTSVIRDGIVYGFAVDPTTFDLSIVPGSPFLLRMTKVAGEPSGQFVIGVDGSNTVNVMPIEQGTGTLGTPVPYPSSAAGDSILVHPSGKFVYIYSLGNPMEGFSFSAGALTPLTASPFTAFPILHPCKLDQNGSALFGITPATGNFTVRTIDSTTGLISASTAQLTVTSTTNFAPSN